MGANTSTIERYMDAFRRTDRAAVLGCLTDDVEWEVPGAFRIRGKDAFNSHIVDNGFVGDPDIRVSRLLESGDVVVAEGTVLTKKTDGAYLNIVFCDVFEMRDGLICRLVSYLMVVS